MDSFPSNPSNRRVIYVLSQHDLERCQYESNGADFLLNEEASVIPFDRPAMDSDPRTLTDIRNSGLIRPGNTLIQSPFSFDQYEEISKASEQFALEKHLCFSNLCMHLGAKSVEVVQVNCNKSRSQTDSSVGGASKGVGADVEVGFSTEDQLKSKMSLRDNFTGGPPDIDAAEELLRTTGLLRDPTMRSLFEMRKASNNSMVGRMFELDLSSESSSNLEIAARVGVPKFIKLSVDVKRITNNLRTFTLKVAVNF